MKLIEDGHGIDGASRIIENLVANAYDLETIEK